MTILQRIMSGLLALAGLSFCVTADADHSVLPDQFVDGINAAATFYWVSQIGMLPATIAYVNAGRQLAEVRSMSGILSMKVMLSCAALGLLPLVSR